MIDSWGIYSPPLTSKHLNVELIGGETNAAFLNSMALMWWLPWTLPLRRLINLALVIKILPICFGHTLFQKMSQHHWSNMHSFSTVVKWKHDTKIIVHSTVILIHQGEQCFPCPTCVLLVLLFHLRKQRLLLAKATQTTERRICYWRSWCYRTAYHDSMRLWGFLHWG